jgi:hypothetical protein
MSPLLWLALAIAAGVGAYVVGWPAWSGYRSRDRRDSNTERYLAWRGRAVRGQPSTPEGMTGDERRRVSIGGALAIVAVASLLAFFVTS